MDNVEKSTAIQSAQTQQLFSASMVSLISSVLLAAVLGSIQRDVIDSVVVGAWFSCVVFASLVRALLVMSYRRATLNGQFVSLVWLNRYRWSALFAGFVWGLSCLLLFPPDYQQYQMLLVVVLIGLASGAIVSFSADMVCSLGFASLTLIPLTIRLYITGSHMSMILGTATALYFAFMVMNLRNIYKHIRDNVVLRLEAVGREGLVKASEERYSLLLSHLPVGIFHFDSNLTITYCNTKLANILNSSVENLMGMDIKQIRDQSILPALSAALRGEMGSYRGFYRATRSNAEGWVELNCAPFLNSDGSTVGGIAIVQDISERRLSELRDHWHVNVLELLVKGAPLPSVLNAVVGGIEQINPEMMCSILLLTGDGKHLTAGAAPSLPDFYNVAIEGLEIGSGVGSCGTAAFTGKRVIVEDIATHPYWEKFRELTKKAGLGACWSEPIKDSNGRMLGTFAIYHHSPHAPKEQDIALIVQSGNLASLAIERKRGEADILGAKEKAEALAQSKSEFIANMSHEIRTPMNAIIGLSQLALNQPTSDEVRDYLEKINVSSESLLGILNGILDFSKMEAGKLGLENTRFSLQVLLDNLRKLFSFRATEKHVELVIEADAALPDVWMGDPLRLQQILSNLLGNALKFTDQGRVGVHVQLLELDDAIARIRFSVSDTGIGISAEEMGRLFQPFSQADTSITRRFGGTGLGLAISYRLLQLMDSHLEVDSTPNVGTTFSFDLLLEVSALEVGREASVRQAERNPGVLANDLRTLGGQLVGKRILLAEDNLINQKVVLEFLKLSDVVADVANNGLEALQLLNQYRYDAVLMDMQMPEMSGVEATEQIRQQPQYAALPIIALTAGVTREDRDKCKACGMNDFLAKPVNPRELISVLNHWVEDTAVAQGAAWHGCDAS